MKTIKIFLIAFAFLSANAIFAQNNNEKFEQQKVKVNNAVDQTNTAIEESNQAIKETSASLKTSLNSSKETFNDLKGMFKSNKVLNIILITINNIEYGNAKLKLLQNAILKSKGVKKSSNNFQDNIATIEVSYKKNADKLWENIPTNISSSFKVVSINEKEIHINLKDM